MRETITQKRARIRAEIARIPNTTKRNRAGAIARIIRRCVMDDLKRNYSIYDKHMRTKGVKTLVEWAEFERGIKSRNPSQRKQVIRRVFAIYNVRARKIGMYTTDEIISLANASKTRNRRIS